MYVARLLCIFCYRVLIAVSYHFIHFVQLFDISVDSAGRVHVRSLKTPQRLDFEQTFQFYEGAEGNNKVFANRSSGAYIFRPKENHTKDLPVTSTYQIFKGMVM